MSLEKIAFDPLALQLFHQREAERKAQARKKAEAKEKAQARKKAEDAAKRKDAARKAFIQKQFLGIAIFLFGGDIVDNKDFLDAFQKYIEERLATCSCAVLYRPSSRFVEFMENHPDLPDIGRKEVIIYDPSMKNVRFFEDYRYQGLSRGTRLYSFP